MCDQAAGWCNVAGTQAPGWNISRAVAEQPPPTVHFCELHTLTWQAILTMS